MGLRDIAKKHNPLRTKTYGGGLVEDDPTEQANSRRRAELRRVVDDCRACQKIRGKGRPQGAFCGKHGTQAAKIGLM